MVCRAVVHSASWLRLKLRLPACVHARLMVTVLMAFATNERFVVFDRSASGKKEARLARRRARKFYAWPT